MTQAAYKSLIFTSVTTVFLASCTTTTTQQAGHNYSQTGTRIEIPQEKVSTQRPIPQKVVPESYVQWLSVGDHRQRVYEYEQFLAKNNVGSIIPSFELLRTARDWQKCGVDEYAVPNRELWNNQIATLRVFKYLIATKVLTDFEVTSVYRDLPTNRCAGGATSSRHLFNSAIDFRIGPQYPKGSDFSFIDDTKYKICQFWYQYGQSLNMGVGLYASGQIHIDTQGYRTWGPNLSHASSMCSGY
ncbi:D-Ala-D-Ala carboxypeptidase family metallohydrolase [Acinetobacter sp. MD2(2019)]|uniref:D-Ala-D-Ala carboxypeptidase family metallohydrolase n=1 Tax=Acinetobacter sp. MD2(2019) TaxID=2605273 RepID=UPI002D1EE5A9|nr:D-Ala-D-Ala carboxypeptidase family metallohydrolase [Acinetobacter sp. MD2(2019)]MEB3752798.1 peptidase M15 [Acinetobacter sp. MD2(2019)]